MYVYSMDLHAVTHTHMWDHTYEFACIFDISHYMLYAYVHVCRCVLTKKFYLLWLRNICQIKRSFQY